MKRLMIKQYRSRFRVLPLATLIAVFFLTGVFSPSFALAPPEVFGYNILNTGSGQPALFILVDFPPVDVDSADWTDFAFNPDCAGFGYNKAFKANSCNQFQLIEGAAVPIQWPDGMQYNTNGISADMYRSNAVYQVMLDGNFSFTPYDTNHDGWVYGSDELILAILGEDLGLGQTRSRLSVPNPYGLTSFTNKTVALELSKSPYRAGVHEICHLLGCIDLYGHYYDSGSPNGVLHDGLTLMGPTDRINVYLDPWHRLRLGWCEPRVMSLLQGGIINLPAGQLEDPTGPVILYDANRGVTEYFILEYRSQSNATFGVGGDVDLPGDGMVIWHVRHDASRNPVTYINAVFGYPYPGHSMYEKPWRQCGSCNGIVRNEDITAGTYLCAGSNTYHVEGDSPTYILNLEETATPFEDKWRRCNKCGMLYDDSRRNESVCAVSGDHSPDSDIFSIRVGGREVVGLNWWRRCTKCQSLVYKYRGPSCPAGGDHDWVSGEDYVLFTDESSAMAVLARASPDLTFGRNELWGSGMETPVLTWYDGSSTGVRIRVHPYAQGSDYINVEWLNVDAEVWVDFNAFGVIEDGSEYYPYNTLREGESYVLRGGTINIRTGMTGEHGRFEKPLRMQAVGGTVTIGN